MLRPLAGFWFLNATVGKRFESGELGFRPLAGFWFLNKSLCMHQQQESGSFRPLAGALYLSFPRRYGGSGEQREPMGALVACVHF